MENLNFDIDLSLVKSLVEKSQLIESIEINENTFSEVLASKVLGLSDKTKELETLREYSRNFRELSLNLLSKEQTALEAFGSSLIDNESEIGFEQNGVSITLPKREFLAKSTYSLMKSLAVASDNLIDTELKMIRKSTGKNSSSIFDNPKKFGYELNISANDDDVNVKVNLSAIVTDKSGKLVTFIRLLTKCVNKLNSKDAVSAKEIFEELTTENSVHKFKFDKEFIERLLQIRIYGLFSLSCKKLASQIENSLLLNGNNELVKQ